MSEVLLEFVDSRGVNMGVDRDKGVIRGVKILGFVSRNGRRYLPDALKQAVKLYENAKVNVNHPKGDPLRPRDYQDRIGIIRNVEVRPDEGLFADLHFNSKHALAEQLGWDAENAPENVGFSHNVQAKTTRHADETVVDAIVKVQSVDLVADPATTRGLFEQVSQNQGESEETVVAENTVLKSLSLGRLKESRADLVEQLLEDQSTEIGELKEKLQQLQITEAAQKRRDTIRHLLAEFNLPDPDTAKERQKSILGERLIETLMAMPNEKEVRELIGELAQLVQNYSGRFGGQFRSEGVPVSREQTEANAKSPLDAKAFVETIT